MMRDTHSTAASWGTDRPSAGRLSRYGLMAAVADRGRVFGALVSGLAVCLLAVAAATGFDGTECERILRESIQRRAFPGGTAVVGTEQTVLWSAAIGHHDYSGSVPVRADAIYDLASVTKVAGTTTVFMRLVALGKVRLDDPIVRFVPEFLEDGSEFEHRAHRERVTVEHLLTHSAGLGSWRPFYRRVGSYAELIAELCRTPLEAAPGERHRYSDTSLMLAGEVAARAGGQPLPRLERELVFDPLGMTDTWRCPPPELLARIPPTEVEAATGQAVHGVVHDENARAGEGETGHAGLFATADDLGKLAAELLRGAQGQSQLFPRDVVDQFFRPRPVGGTVRAVGWNVSADGEGTILSHTGFTGTWMLLDLGRKRYTVLLTNRVHPSRDNQQITRVRSEFRAAVERQWDADLSAEP
jgi:serine-type D-Ala-D-Ala carboxypeptidase